MERLPVLLQLGGYPKAFSARTGKRQADLENDVVGEFPDVTAIRRKQERDGLVPGPLRRAAG